MTKETDSSLLDSAFLERLRVLWLRLRTRRHLQRRGLQSTPSLGSSREFKDYRTYTPGDDYRSIDWRLFARQERPFVKVYEDIQELHVHLLIDTSLSMALPDESKAHTARQVAAALGALSLIGQHRVSLTPLSSESSTTWLGQDKIQSLLHHLQQIPFTQSNDLETALQSWRPSPRRKGIVFVISDFLGRHPHHAHRYASIAALWPTETHFIHLIHPHEKNPPYHGHLELIDAETSQKQRFHFTESQKQTYIQNFTTFCQTLSSTSQQKNINYTPWDTQASLETQIASLFTRGSALFSD